ncbi:MAG TPA: glycosyltransferase [Myxococcota bacterium]|nr:glycosyltransferase [Myxococcota bacterium]
MIVGIDASNVRIGGSVTHLVNVLANVAPERFGVSRIIVWGNRKTLTQLADRAWLEKVHCPPLDRALPARLLWQWLRLPALARARCDLLFSPGGNAPGGFAPLVAMSRNMLPFAWSEHSRYGISLEALRILLLRWGQTRTFERAQGVIFLTRYAHDAVRAIARVRGEVAIIPHGVEERFRATPRVQRDLAECSFERPLRLLYPSTVDVYKHQWVVAEAVANLRADGVPVAIDFVGRAYAPALRRLERALARLDPAREFLRYRGLLAYEQMHSLRDASDVFVFASSCENMPNILLEGMASGFPIACARRGPMPEILGDAGIYFEPEDAVSIEEALRALICDAALRAKLAAAAHARARDYSWERCARDTFAFLERVARAARGDATVA